MKPIEEFDVEINQISVESEKRCYTVEDLQYMLGIARGTVYKLLEENEFRWFRVGRTYRISKKSFDEWLDNKL